MEAATGLPGQAIYNQYHHQIRAVSIVARRILSVGFLIFAAVKYRAPVGQYALIQQEFDETLSMEERSKIARGMVVLSLLFAAILYIQTIPLPGKLLLMSFCQFQTRNTRA